MLQPYRGMALDREWLDAVHVGNDAPRIFFARVPATAPPPLLPAPRASCFFKASRCPFLFFSRCCHQAGSGPEPNFGVGEIAFRLVNLAHGYARG